MADRGRTRRRARARDPFERASDRAQQARWFSFDSEWSYDIAWDIGLAVLDPDERRLVVLAATDTD